MATSFAGLPDELITQIFLRASTPTFLQLTRTCKKFFDLASQSRELLLYHLNELPGEKTGHTGLDNVHTFLLLRQRAANALVGVNFTANMHEYVTRDVVIDPSASAIGGLDADYVRMALCFKDGNDIRQYTSHCAIKEKIRQISTPGTKILKLVQWSRFVSVLCSSRLQTEFGAFDFTDGDQSDSETEMLERSYFPPTTNSRLQTSGKHTKPHESQLTKEMIEDHRYRVIHFDVYTMEDSHTFEVFPPLGMVPRDFAVQSSSLCAILWDKSTPTRRPTEHAIVATYTINARDDHVAYESKNVWPKSGKPVRADEDSDEEDDVPEKFPERIAFFKEGRRIKMYGSGDPVPYQIFSTSTTQHVEYASTNVINFDGFSVHVDTPFFGTHTTQVDELSQQSYCFQHHLCLGIATINVIRGDNEDEVKILCILRSQNKYYSDGCDHRISLSRMTHVSANNSTIVARLWGWEEMRTNFSGKDIVAVSPGGTRIAIAMWNKVLVYPVNPKVMCDEVVVDSSDEESPKSRRKKKKARKPWETPCTDYYKRPKDKNLLGWRVAEIRPIVFDLEGAVAQKMSWSPAKGSVTDTEEKPVLPANDTENSGSDFVKVEEALQTNPDELVPTQASSVEGMNAAPEVPVPVVEDSASTHPAGGAVVQQENEVVQATSAIPYVGEGLPALGVSSEEVPETPANANTQTSLSNTAPEVPVGSTQLSNTQSPLQIAKSEKLQTHNDVNSNTPSSPPTTFSTLPSLHSAGLAALSSLSCTPQTSKPSPRKKEKGLEVNSSYTTSPAHIEKKQQTGSVYGEGFPNGHLPLSSTSSTLKSGYPVSNATEESTLALTFSTKLSSEALPSIAAPTVNPFMEHVNGQLALSAPTLSTKATQESDLEDPVSMTPSKNPSNETSSSRAPDTTQNDQDETELKSAKHKKRITEDELIIMTDRGVQIWNIGARAKGKRKRSLLKVEESLRGKLPVWKGKERSGE